MNYQRLAEGLRRTVIRQEEKLKIKDNVIAKSIPISKLEELIADFYEGDEDAIPNIEKLINEAKK